MSSRESKIHALNISHMRATQNSMPGSARQSSIEALDSIVASLTDLALSARQAHWNVRGRQVLALHDLFARVSDEMFQHANMLAERSAALGGMPRCTAAAVVAGTMLKPYPSFCSDGSEHIDELGGRLAAVGAGVREVILQVDANADRVTVHLLIEACASVDHLLWLLESHQPVDDSDRPEKGIA